VVVTGWRDTERGGLRLGVVKRRDLVRCVEPDEIRTKPIWIVLVLNRSTQKCICFNQNIDDIAPVLKYHGDVMMWCP